jgi:P5-type ATPase cation transporter
LLAVKGESLNLFWSLTLFCIIFFVFGLEFGCYRNFGGVVKPLKSETVEAGLVTVTRYTTLFFVVTPIQDIESFEGYRAPAWRRVLFGIAGIFSGGLLFLFAHWSTKIYIWLTLQRTSLRRAQYVLVSVSMPRITTRLAGKYLLGMQLGRVD